MILPSTDALPAAPHPDWLRTFGVFAEHLNFVKSAELLQLSQPAVHAQVAKLAAHYGEALYRREGRILRLTDVGRRVSAFAREILERSARFEAELVDRTAGRPATLAAGEGVWLHLLAAPVGRGDLQVRPVVMRGPEIRQSVSRGDVDIGVVVGAPAGPGMDSMLLRESDRVLAVRSDHRLARGPDLLARGLARVPLVAPPSGAPQRELLEGAAAAAGVELDVVLEVRGWPLTLRFVQQGLGAAVVNAVCELPEGVVARPIRGLPSVKYRAIRRAGALRSLAAQEAWAALRRFSAAAPPR